MGCTAVRIVHATVLLDFGGAYILTDPWFSQRPIFGYLHGEPSAIANPADLPPLSGVVISHRHYDHCDLGAFAAYPDKKVPFAVVRGLAGRVRAAGFPNVVELEPWQSTHLGPVRVTAAPAKHGVPEVTFVLEADGESVFFGADTLRIAELDEVAQRFGELDLALLPINGLRIRPAFNRQVVMDALEAAELTSVLRPRLAVPIHYAFTGGPILDRVMLKLDRDRPELYQQAVDDVAPDTAVHVLAPGQPLSV
jgi:L-ascorbate metabolism protein UlaG (beta-lactamase superfamily)